jgi:DNA polymerase III epsilon subunit-like protein
MPSKFGRKILDRKNRVVLSSKGRRAVGSDRQSFFFCCDAPTTKHDYSTNMSSPKRPARAIDRPAPKLRKCGSCGQLGHDRRTCSVVLPEEAVEVARIVRQANDGENVVNEGVPRPPPDQATVQEASQIDWGNVLYVVLDIETTGRSKEKNEVIKLAGLILDSSGVEIEDANISDLVKPNRPIPGYITELTTITNDNVSMALSFPEVADKFLRFISEQADNKGNVQQIILVGHNAKGFDIPFLVHQLNVHGMSGRLFEDQRIRYGIDTLQLARNGIKVADKTKIGTPTAYNLPTLFQFVSGRLPSESHRAMADVKATATVFRFPVFFDQRTRYYFELPGRVAAAPQRNPVAQAVENDSETESESESGDSGQSVSSHSVTSHSSTDTDDEPLATVPEQEAPQVINNLQHTTAAVPLGDRWELDVDYLPVGSPPSQRFQEFFSPTGRSQRQKTGLLCSPIDVNTPIRAWRQVFTHALRDWCVGGTETWCIACRTTATITSLMNALGEVWEALLRLPGLSLSLTTTSTWVVWTLPI